MTRWFRLLFAVVLLCSTSLPTFAQQGGKAKGKARAKENSDQPPTSDVLSSLEKDRDQFLATLKELKQKPISQTVEGERLFADVAVFEKAATWMLRFQEFPKADFVDQLKGVLKKGEERAASLGQGEAPWDRTVGCAIRGYVSKVDGSLQPYALTLPDGVNPADGKRWPLHVVLHGRADQMNEVNFIHRMDGKTPKRPDGVPEQTWIQLDVYGRGNNAYRWAGETDVFEAMDDVKRRFRIDESRITLHGFSMGGAGAWHLGMHHPSVWSSVGPGAGFVDFYRYQKKDPNNPAQRLPEIQHQTLAIYDAVNYALNAFNVPVCTYGGEEDPQLLASTSMFEAAESLGVSIKVIVGPKMGHAFDPESQKQFMAFHLEQSTKGKPRFGERKEIRFTTSTLRYNNCDWLSIEEVAEVYEPSTVDASLSASGDVEITTTNVAALKLSREAGTNLVIDGQTLDCRMAADGLLPDVYYVHNGREWSVLDYDESRGFAENPELRKRHGLQGPIDDAFMDSFVCVRGNETPWHATSQAWSNLTLDRMQKEFAQWMRGDVRMVDSDAVTEEMIATSHLVLFGDPGSNPLMARVIKELPVEWTREKITVGDQSWPSQDHGLCMIYPNPLNRSKYVVLNSGHTFHEKDFRSSNAYLFPRLGDIAIQKTVPPDGKETLADPVTVWSGIFNSRWQL